MQSVYRLEIANCYGKTYLYFWKVESAKAHAEEINQETLPWVEILPIENGGTISYENSGQRNNSYYIQKLNVR